jgi:hypothetical protein
MSITLTPVLESFVTSFNAQDSTTFVAQFTPDAVVHDEGREHRGSDAIKSWIEEAWKKYHPTLEVTGVTENGTETILTGVVSGTFDGSPLELHYHIAVTNAKIAALRITA